MSRLNALIGPGAIRISPKGKDVSEWYLRDRSNFKKELNHSLTIVEDCSPLPRSEDERFTQQRLRHLLSEASERLGRADTAAIVTTLKSNLGKMASTEIGFPDSLGQAALSGVVGKFVEAALPFTEAD